MLISFMVQEKKMRRLVRGQIVELYPSSYSSNQNDRNCDAD
jgi:hypothetical protein